MFKIITIPYDPMVRGFDDELLNKFLANKQVKSYQAELITASGDPAWTIFIEYEPIFETPSVPPPKSLNKQQQLLFDRLKKWRKDRADKDGVPVYVLATNKELASIATDTPKNLEALKTIHGFGQGKISKYGSDIINIVNAFFDQT